LIAGSSCVDFSLLNNKKKGIDDGGESGDTIGGILSYAKKFRPTIIILENVGGPRIAADSDQAIIKAKKKKAEELNGKKKKAKDKTLFTNDMDAEDINLDDLASNEDPDAESKES